MNQISLFSTIHARGISLSKMLSCQGMLAEADFVVNQQTTLMADLLIVAGGINASGAFKFKIMDLFPFGLSRFW